MKRILLVLALMLCGCDRRVSKDIEVNKSGHVNINGKECELVSLNAGDSFPRVLFIDCGPGSSSVTYPQGKTQQSVGQYTPVPTPPVITAEPTCICGSPSEEMKKVQEIKKNFYGPPK